MTHVARKSECVAMTDVVVVGGGIMGAALAYELAARGVAVTLVDSGQLCGGSSGRNAGGVRQQFSHPLNVTLARETVTRMTSFGDEFGTDIGLHQVGYLFLISDPDHAAAMRDVVGRQNALGLSSSWLSPGEIAALVPGLEVDDLLGGAFGPGDGYLDPHAVVMSYAAAARDRGAVIRQFCGVVGVDVAGGRAVGARLADGTRLSCGAIVNCAGVWAPEVAALYGETLPIACWRSQSFQITGIALPPGCPMTIDFDHDKAYFHPDGAPDSGSAIAGLDTIVPSPIMKDVPFDESTSELLVERLVARMPAFADARIAGGWGGLLEITPDENPIVGWSSALGSCYTAAGFSGHGLSLAPALAVDVAAELVGDEPAHDLAPFRPVRFGGSGAVADGGEALAMR